MRTLVGTRWMLHGESGVPLWVLVPALILALYLLLRWLRAERRRPTVASRLLPVTGTLLAVLCVWVLWKPALVRIDEWEHTASTLTYIDASASMGMPLGTGNLSDDLDTLAFWGDTNLPERVTAPRELAALLADLREQAADQASHLRALSDEIAQQLPPGDHAHDTLAAYSEWAQTAADRGLRGVESVRPVLERPWNEDTEGPPAELPADLDALTGHCERLSLQARQPTLSMLPELIRDLGALVDTASTASAVLRKLQLLLDEELLRALPPLAPLLEASRRRTRSEAASLILSGSPHHEAAPVTRVADETDIYRDVAQVLAKSKAGIRVTAVGVGLPDHKSDYGILDWSLPSALRAGDEASLTVWVKAPAEVTPGAAMVLAIDGQQAASLPLVEALAAHGTASIPFKAPAEGRHILSIELAIADANPANNRVRFALRTFKSAPRTLLVGKAPNWDTAYLYLACARAGLRARQVFHGITDEPPERGGSSSAIPSTLEQWARNQAVILHGAPFAGFTPEDAETLRRYVFEKGGSLILVVEHATGYPEALADVFGWDTLPAEAADTRLLLPPGAQHLPVARLGVDGPTSARRFASLGPCAAAHRVPGQDVALLRNAVGQTLLSLGFYGRGKVYLCGLSGLQKASAYARGLLVQQFLAQLMADAAGPLFGDTDLLACYPELPVPGRVNRLISLANADTARITQGDRVTELPLEVVASNAVAVLMPASAGPLQVACGDAALNLVAVANPGLEQIRHEFNEAFVRDFAQRAGGRYTTIHGAREALAGHEPLTWKGETARRHPLAEHWLLWVAIAAAGGLHWTLRKLAGLAI